MGIPFSSDQNVPSGRCTGAPQGGGTTKDAAVTAVELADFLRTRRALLTRDGSGDDTRRRPPGLRHDELARLAGISPTYYLRLEQGHSINADPAVIDALARALHLTAAEHAYLAELARPACVHRRTRQARPERPRPALLRLLTAMTEVPAVLLDRRTGVLGWNRLGHALLAGHYDDHEPRGPNLTRLLFLDPHTRELYRDWHAEACHAVARLRLLAARGEDDPALTELVGDLTVRSHRFSRLWNSRPPRLRAGGAKRLRHPLLGELTLDCETLHAGDGTGQCLLTFGAPPGSRDETTLRLLGATIPAARHTTTQEAR